VTVTDEHGDLHPAADGTGAQPAPSIQDASEVRLQDGTKMLLIDGQAYREDDPRLEAAANALGSESTLWGLSLIWVYIGLPVVALLLFALLAPFAGCAG